MEKIYQAILDLIHQGRRGAVATVIQVKGSSPQVVGAKMLIRDDATIVGTVGGGMMEAKVLQKALEIIKSQVPATVAIDLAGKTEESPICGGEAEVFIEPVSVKPRIVIFGAGHVGACVAQIGAICGFRVLVTDDREEWANAEKLPYAHEIVVQPFDKMFKTIQLNPSDYVVIVTRGHAYDELCLEHTIKKPLTYLGMIGSKRKIAQVFNNLEKKGIARSSLEKVHSPIGIDIAAISPAEIAVSIMAEIIQVFREQDSGSKTCPT